MSVTLTAEQFASLINNVNVAPQSKKKTKSLIKDYVNAMNFEDFLTNFKYLRVTRLQTTSLVEFVVETIKLNIEQLEDNEMPFVCANTQRRIFYYKSKGEWIKSQDFIKIIHSKVVKQCYKELLDNYTEEYKDDLDTNDDEQIAKRYDSSRHSTKQEIIMNLCCADKWSYEKIFDKILNKLGVLLKTGFEIEK
jgi:ribosomal protein S17E